MSINLTRRSVIACISVIACAVLVPIAMRAANSPSTLEACINPGNGMMRLVDSSTACHDNESRVSWNITGPAGDIRDQYRGVDRGSYPSSRIFSVGIITSF